MIGGFSYLKVVLRYDGMQYIYKKKFSLFHWVCMRSAPLSGQGSVGLDESSRSQGDAGVTSVRASEIEAQTRVDIRKRPTIFAH